MRMNKFVQVVIIWGLIPYGQVASSQEKDSSSSPDSVQIAWVVHYSGPDSSGEVTAMVADAEGNIYVTGGSEGDYATVKYNASGVQLWLNYR